MKEGFGMLKKLLFSLAILAGILLALNLVSAVDISSCQTLDSTNGVYTLTSDVSSNGTCFRIQANNVTLNCQGFMINYSINSRGSAINNSNHNSTTIKNCNIYQGNSTLSGYITYALYIFNSNQPHILNNTATTYSSSSYGIYLASSKNSNISKNSVNIYGNNGIPLYISSSFNSTVFNNSLTTSGNLGSGNSANGIYIATSSNLSIIGNTINSTFSGDALYIQLDSNSPSIEHYNHQIENNTEQGKLIYYYFNLSNRLINDSNNIGQLILAFSSNITIRNYTFDKDAITFIGTTNSTIADSNISIWRNYGSAIYLTYGSHYNDISSNWINDTLGIYTFTSNYNNITNNVINTYGGSGHTLDISWSNYSIISNNNLTTYGASSRSIQLSYSLSTRVLNNNVLHASGSSGEGIWLAESKGNSIIGNNVTTYADSSSDSLHIRANSNDNFFSSNYLFNNWQYGINIQYSSTNNTFTKMNVVAAGSGYYPVFISAYGNLSFIMNESVLNFSSYVWQGKEVYIQSTQTGSIINFTNVTRQDSSGATFSWHDTFEGLLNVKYYLDINVSNTTAQVGNANVTLYDNAKNIIFSEMSDNDGKIARKTLLEFYKNSTASKFFTNYNLSVVKSGYNNYINPDINLSTNRYLAAKLYSPDQEIPAQLTIYSPKNTTYYKNQTIILRANAFNSNPQSVWYSNDSGRTNNSYTLGEAINLTIAVNGSYMIKFYANNSANNVTEYSIPLSVATLPEHYKFALNATVIYINRSITRVIVAYGISLKQVVVENNITTHIASIDFSQIMDNRSVNIGNASLNLSRTASYNHTLELLPATIITGDENWDGSLELPFVNTSSFSVASGNVNTVISAGASTSLNFTEPTKIVLGGMHGKSAAWSESNLTLTKISTYCDSLANPTNINADTTRECYINAENGQDLVIWSYHLSNFAAYTPATTTTASSSSGGGGTYKGKVYSLTEEQLKNGYEQFLGYDDKLEFKIDNKIYYIKIKEVNNYKAILVISNAIEVDLINNEERLLDFMVDGKKYVLYLKVNYINSVDKISLTIRKIMERKTGENKRSITGMLVSEETSNYKNYALIAVLTIIILIVLFLVVFARRRRKNLF